MVMSVGFANIQFFGQFLCPALGDRSHHHQKYLICQHTDFGWYQILAGEFITKSFHLAEWWIFWLGDKSQIMFPARCTMQSKETSGEHCSLNKSKFHAR
jgi:hypothetical protein